MNITELLTGIANAIREKKQSTQKIKAENFADEISAIQGVNLSDINIIPKDVTKNKLFINKTGKKQIGTARDYQEFTSSIGDVDIKRLNRSVDPLADWEMKYKDYIFSYYSANNKLNISNNQTGLFDEYTISGIGTSGILSVCCENVFQENTVCVCLYEFPTLIIYLFDLNTDKLNLIKSIDVRTVGITESSTYMVGAPSRNLMCIGTEADGIKIFEINADFTLSLKVTSQWWTNGHSPRWIDNCHLAMSRTLNYPAQKIVAVYFDGTTEEIMPTYNSTTTASRKEIIQSISTDGNMAIATIVDGGQSGTAYMGEIAIYKCSINSNGKITLGTKLYSLFNSNFSSTYNLTTARFMDNKHLWLITKNSTTVKTLYFSTFDNGKYTILSQDASISYSIRINTGNYPEHIIFYYTDNNGQIAPVLFYLDKEDIIDNVLIDNNKLYNTQNANISADDILINKIAYGKDGKIIGNIQNNGQLNYIPSTEIQTIPKGYTEGGTISAVTSSIDANIKPENIKKDINILGINGELESEDSETTSLILDFISGNTSYSSSNRLVLLMIKKITLNISENFIPPQSTYGMFQGCTNLVNINNLDILDTSNVKQIGRMFYGCNSLTELNLSNFNTSKVTDMEYMFNGCYSLTELNLSNFNTENVTNMRGMFTSCRNLTELNLSNFNTSKVTLINEMFNGCSKLITILGVLDLISATNVSSILLNCYYLENIKIKNLNITGLSLTNCGRLSYESLIYLIENLVPTSTSKTISLGSTNLSKLTDEEKAIATSKGWTLT